MTGADFWSRRKAGVAAEAEAERVAIEDAESTRARAALEGKTDEEILAEFGLQDPDTMESGDDFKAFLQAAVPERLRRRALRRLWRSNPVLANLDGLNDYDADYTDAATVVPDLKTAYQVGRGMLEHVRALQSKADASMTETNAPTETEPSLTIAASGTTPADESEPDDTAETPQVAETDSSPAPQRRRMRFDFTDSRETATA